MQTPVTLRRWVDGSIFLQRFLSLLARGHPMHAGATVWPERILVDEIPRDRSVEVIMADLSRGLWIITGKLTRSAASIARPEVQHIPLQGSEDALDYLLVHGLVGACRHDGHAHPELTGVNA
jgi:hypothetical protein